MAAQADVSIRHGGPSDCEAVGKLWLEHMNYHVSLDSRLFKPAADGPASYCDWVKHCLSDGSGCVLVAEEEGVLIGFIFGKLTQAPPGIDRPEFGYIIDLIVTEGHRGGGVGTRLAETMLQWFSDRGAPEVLVGTAMANEGARHFWETMGFSPLTMTHRRPTDARHEA